MKKEDLEKLAIGQRLVEKIEERKERVKEMKSLLAGDVSMSIAFYQKKKSEPDYVYLPQQVHVHAVKDYISELEKEIEKLEKEFADL